ncbi:hypothetical protein BXZ70DRAFT_59746 [Cristinia sonorae]|uniref:DUF6533 domain-containing protein n=1 Tax=Cristinia sonorae TaxID=1940300 RepID=A0A8K0USG9_9AGAR|nr:hypothetical protein BXZ70DRAFT_59746 [Cristinia sonorae]
MSLPGSTERIIRCSRTFPPSIASSAPVGTNLAPLRAHAMNTSKTSSEALSVLFELRIRTYLRFASSAVFVYDYLLTLGQEITFIWPFEWSTVDALYVLTRYLAFADTIVAMFYHLKPNLTAAECKSLTLSSSWILVVGIIVAEAILTLRTWAIWNRGKYIGVFLIAIFTSCMIVACLIEGLFLGSLTFAPSFNDAIPGCILTDANPAVGVEYVIVIVLETVVVLLTLLKVFQQRRADRQLGRPEHHGLAHVLYRDGLHYYMYPLAISIVNFVAVLKLPSYSADLLSGLQRVIHSTLTARVILNLREALSRRQTFSISEIPSTRSGIIFAPEFSVTNSGSVSVEE